MSENIPTIEEYEAPALFEVGSLHEVTQGQLWASGHDQYSYLGFPHFGS